MVGNTVLADTVRINSHEALEGYLHMLAARRHYTGIEEKEPLIRSSGNTSSVFLKCNFRPGSAKATSLFCASP